MRSLAEVVSEEDFAGTNESEYLETVFVAVPKWVDLCRLLCDRGADLARAQEPR